MIIAYMSRIFNRQLLFEVVLVKKFKWIWGDFFNFFLTFTYALLRVFVYKKAIFLPLDCIFLYILSTRAINVFELFHKLSRLPITITTQIVQNMENSSIEKRVMDVVSISLIKSLLVKQFVQAVIWRSACLCF